MRSFQALQGEVLEVHAVDGVDALNDAGQAMDDGLYAQMEDRLRGNEFFRDCLATSTVTLKVSGGTVGTLDQWWPRAKPNNSRYGGSNDMTPGDAAGLSVTLCCADGPVRTNQ